MVGACFHPAKSGRVEVCAFHARFLVECGVTELNKAGERRLKRGKRESSHGRPGGKAKQRKERTTRMAHTELD